jgi:hypothetical protein
MRDALLQIILLLVISHAVGQTSTVAWANGPREKVCGLGTYQDSLDLAFKNATEGSGETLVMVEVLPSFQREYALVIKRAGSEVNLVRTKFQTPLWHQLAPLQSSRTRQQCLQLASAATLDTVTFTIRPETASSLLSGFGNIRLMETDNCPRNGKECAHVLDGTAYVVLPKDGPPVRITETERLKGVRSENQALLDWIRSLLQAANDSQPQ